MGRHANTAQPDEQDVREEEDSMNADTFGSASGSGAANNGAAAARPAWSSAGASVALVAGSTRSAYVLVACTMHNAFPCTRHLRTCAD